MKVISSKPVSLTEVARLLNERKKEGSGELEYEQSNTLTYAETFATLDKPTLASFTKEVAEVAPIPEAQVLQIADLLPRNEDELAQVLSVGKVELPKEQLKELVKVIKKYKKA